MVPVRIYDSVNLQNTLHADIEVPNSDLSTNSRYTPVLVQYSFCKRKKAFADERPIQIAVRQNRELPCQMWSFTGCTQLGPDDHKLAESTHKILRRPDVMIG